MNERARLYAGGSSPMGRVNASQTRLTFESANGESVAPRWSTSQATGDDTFKRASRAMADEPEFAARVVGRGWWEIATAARISN